MDNKFRYTYNPREEKTIKEIVAKYEKVMDSNYAEIVRLNKEAERPVKLTFAVHVTLSTLLFGAGLSICLVLFQYVLGAIVGTVGMFCMIGAFRYRDSYMEKRQREYAPRILALARKEEDRQD